jgi:hypothetical protein
MKRCAERGLEALSAGTLPNHVKMIIDDLRGGWGTARTAGIWP